MARWRTRVAGVGVGLSLFVGATRGEAPPAERFAGQIRECKESLGWLKDYWSGQLDRAQQAPSFGRLDVALLTGKMEEEMAAWSGAMAEWEKGNQGAAEALVKRAREVGNTRGTWERRLDWRYQQGAEAPSEDSYEGFDWRPRPGAAAVMEAKKRVSEGWGKLADAAVPDADPQILARMEDDVAAARWEVEVAELRANWMAEDRSWALRDAVSSPGLTAAQQRLDEYRKQRETMLRKVRREQRELDKYDRLNGPLLRERDTQAELARQARERAAKGK